MIVWGRPLWLLALAIVAALAGFEHKRSRTGGRGIAVRAAIGCLVALALAEPSYVTETDAFVDVALVDRSSSIAPDELARALQEARALGSDTWVLFDETATVATLPPTAIAPQGQRTDLGAGLALAHSLVPLDRPGRIVVWTDGRSTSRRAWPDLGRLAVEPRALEPRRDGSAILYATTERTEVAPGATVLVTATVREGGELTIRRGNEPLAKRSVDAGDVSMPVSIPTDAATGPLSLDLELGDSVATLPLVVKAPPRVLVVAADRRETKALEKALAAEAFDVIVSGPRNTPPLDEIDLVVLADTPTDGRGALPSEVVASLRGWVRAGGGLVAVGGEHAYDLGGWRTSPLAELLPVEIEPAGPQQQGALSLVLAIDKSGSMALGGGGDLVSTVGSRMIGGSPAGSKIRVVTDAMGAAIERLRPTDKIGVLAIDTTATWTIPLQLAEPKAPILATIARMKSGGGGIYISTALGGARDALAADTAPLRHIVLFADTDDAGEERTLDGVSVIDMVRAMAESGITLSVIGIGQPDDPDAGFLAELATSADGRFLLASSTDDLRTLFTDEAERMIKKSLDEQPFHARVRSLDAAIEGLQLGAAPPLASRNKVKPREHAKTVLTADDRGPLLAIWPVGLGRVAAWTSDAGGRWAASWTTWPGYVRFWTQLVRTTARASGDRSTLELVPADGGLEARLLLRDADDRSQALGGRRLEVDGIETAPQLSLQAPGLYTASVPAAPGAFVTARVRDADTVVAERTAVAPPSEERRWLTPDDATLSALAHTAASVPVPTGATALWRGLLWLAVLLLPVDAVLRRPLRR
jgi:uncharacterized membrane protein